MAHSITPQEALIYVMVMVSAADRSMSDNELQTLSAIVKDAPVFAGFPPEKLVSIAESCALELQAEDGLDRLLTQISESLPTHLHDTAYALAIEIAAADHDVPSGELRLLQIFQDRLSLDKLTVAALEYSARARNRRA